MEGRRLWRFQVQLFGMVVPRQRRFQVQLFAMVGHRKQRYQLQLLVSLLGDVLVVVIVAVGRVVDEHTLGLVGSIKL